MYQVINTQPTPGNPSVVYEGSNCSLAMKSCVRRAKRNNTPHYVKRVDTIEELVAFLDSKTANRKIVFSRRYDIN